MRLLKYWKNLRKMLLFTRAIRKNASSTLSAASQLIFYRRRMSFMLLEKLQMW